MAKSREQIVEPLECDELVKLKDEGTDPEDKEEYKAENIFFVPANARWSYLVAQAKNPLIGKCLACIVNLS